MKRMANILTILVATFILLYFYQSNASHHYNLVNSLESSFATSTRKQHVTVEYNLYDTEGNSVFYKLVDFLEENNYDAMNFEQNQRYDFIIDTTVFLYTKDKMNELDFFKSMNGKDVDFTLNNGNYYSSFVHEEGATDIIDFIDSTYQEEFQPKITIKQFKSMLPEQADKQTAMIFLYGEDRNRLVDDINSSDIANYIVSEDPSFVYELAEPESLNIEAIGIFLVLSISTLIVVTVCDLIKQKKEITIRKLFGERNSSLYFDLVAKRYFLNLILYFLTQVLLYVLIIRGVRPIHLLLLNPLLLSFGVYVAFWGFANLISYHALTKVGRATNLKQDSAVRFTNFIALIIKMLLIVLMINPVINLFVQGPLILEEHIVLRKNKTSMLNNLAIESIIFDIEHGIKEPLEHTLNFFEELNWIYHDFSRNYVPEKIMQSVPKDVFKQEFVQHPYIVANCNYLRDYEIKHVDGSPVDFDVIEHNTLLVPATYKDDIFTDVYYHGPNNHTIHIQDTGPFYNYYPLVPSIEMLRQDNPVILFVNKLDTDMGWASHSLSIRNEGNTQDKVNRFLVENSLDNVVYVSNMDNVYNTSMSRSNYQIINFIMTLSLYILMIFIFQYQSVFVYFAENSTKLAVNYLFGKTYIQRYGILTLNSVMVYFASLVGGISILKINYKLILLYILLGVMLDFITSTIMIRSFERKKLLPALKGDD